MRSIDKLIAIYVTMATDHGKRQQHGNIGKL